MSWLWPSSKTAALDATYATSGFDQAQVPMTPTMTSPSTEAAQGLKRTHDQMYVVYPGSIGDCTC